jgi:hypothetical protein
LLSAALALLIAEAVADPTALMAAWLLAAACALVAPWAMLAPDAGAGATPPG